MAHFINDYDTDRTPHAASHGEAPLAHMVAHWRGVAARRWKLAVSVWVVVMTAATTVLWLLPKQFESSAKFLVRNARQDLLVGPNEGSSGSYRDAVSEETINSELELLRSRDIVVGVVRQLKLDQPYLAEGQPSDLALERAVQDLSRGLSTGAIRRTNLIQVAYQHPDPRTAALIVQRVADGYLAAHLAVHSSPGTYELFRAQAVEAGDELQQAEFELAALARSANLVNPEMQKQEALQSVTVADAQLKAIRAEISEQASRARAAASRMLEVPDRIPTTRRSVPNQYSVERLNTLVVEMQNKRTDLLTKFKPDDRLIVDLERQIADTAAALERASRQSASEEATDVNPLWLELRGDELRAQLAMAGLASKAARLQQQVNDYRSVAQDVVIAGPQYDALLRRVAAARNKYELYVKKEEEARIAEALDKQQISNVVLAQAPYASPIPAQPNMRRGLILGFGVAMGLALGAVLFAEYVIGIRQPVERPIRRPAAARGMASELT